MVSKVAVIALIGILAVPILLGYGLNLSQVTENEYALDGDPVNVTQFLQNSTAYTYTLIDPYQLNTDFSIKDRGSYGEMHRIYPVYEKTSSVDSTFPLRIRNYPSWSSGGTQTLNYPFFYQQFDYDPSVGYTSATVYAMVNGVETQLTNSLTRIYSIYYSNITNEYEISNYQQDPYYGDYRPYLLFKGTAQLTKMVLTPMTAGTANITIWDYSATSYVDFAAGFHFKGYPYTFIGSPSGWRINMPEGTRNFLMSINLDSVTDANSTFRIAPGDISGNSFGLTFNKTTTDGNVAWTVTIDQTGEVTKLYYDPSRNDNTYQLFMDYTKTGVEGIRQYYQVHTKLDYVGSWPELIGQANSYIQYSYDTEFSYHYTSPEWEFNAITVVIPDNASLISPTLRMDNAESKAFGYPAIENNTYTPADFRTNPSTTINNIQVYGPSVTFAGTTYDVASDGNITLGTHKVSLNGIVFDSVPILGGGYENRINGTVVNISADPATITFNGLWWANVSTTAQSATAVNKTEWTPGQFAWNGMDDNFLMVGLITCLGVFIGLGIYARSHRMSIWPLLLVCGGAAALFIFMI